MKQFFKFMFASMLGTILTFIVIFFIFLGIISSLVALTEKQTVAVADKTLLHMKLTQAISDRTPVEPFGIFDMVSREFVKPLGLNDILKNIDRASRDDRIPGIYLELSNLNAGIATIDEIRNALLQFKTSGKFIICYSEGLSQGAYYLATVADEIYMNPEGFVDFRGLMAEVMFLKGTLDKLEIEPQIIRHGKYKSAVEPFMRKDLSESNREQLGAVIGSLWDDYLDKVSEARGESPSALNEYADDLALFEAGIALDYGFVDALLYFDEFYDKLKSKMELDEDAKIRKISIGSYTRASRPGKKKTFERDRIAVIYAIGPIMTGKGSDEVIGSDRIAGAIRKARKDDNVKAIVMRVNSPGGDALASDIILREALLAKEEKPFIVSMGNVAASGGYWISCGADKIIADPYTITGSIGVLAMIPNMQKLFNNKLGITFDNVKTNDNAGFLSISSPMTPYQQTVLEKAIDDIYQKFLAKVAAGRNMTTGQVHEIAQGRIWSGTDAHEIGLIDEIGGLERALELAAEMAEIEDYRIKELPLQKDPIEQIFEDLMGNSRIDSYMKQELGEYYTYYQYLQTINKGNVIQARLPFVLRIF
ncbi:MAG: signal peptide peptidase SppA [Bacteroidota bacterium]|nr:signal peptide peptidase SppA [Bacteroidota bacterium]